MNLKLASEATDYLDFGEGTNIRIKNTTVTLMGKFYRDDSSVLRELEKYKHNYNKLGGILDACGASRSPVNEEVYEWGIAGARIRNLAQTRDELKREISEKCQALYVKINECEDLKRRFDSFKNAAVEQAKVHFFNMIQVVANCK